MLRRPSPPPLPQAPCCRLARHLHASPPMLCPMRTTFSRPCSRRHASSELTKKASASAVLRAVKGGRPAGVGAGAGSGEVGGGARGSDMRGRRTCSPAPATHDESPQDARLTRQARAQQVDGVQPEGRTQAIKQLEQEHAASGVARDSYERVFFVVVGAAALAARYGVNKVLAAGPHRHVGLGVIPAQHVEELRFDHEGGGRGPAGV